MTNITTKGPAILKHDRNTKLHKKMDPICKYPSCGHVITSQVRDTGCGSRLWGTGLQNDHPGQDRGGSTCRKGRGSPAPPAP